MNDISARNYYIAPPAYRPAPATFPASEQNRTPVSIPTADAIRAKMQQFENEGLAHEAAPNDKGQGESFTASDASTGRTETYTRFSSGRLLYQEYGTGDKATNYVSYSKWSGPQGKTSEGVDWGNDSPSLAVPHETHSATFTDGQLSRFNNFAVDGLGKTHTDSAEVGQGQYHDTGAGSSQNSYGGSSMPTESASFPMTMKSGKWVEGQPQRSMLENLRDLF
jgi:hypothetical protein